MRCVFIRFPALTFFFFFLVASSYSATIFGLVQMGCIQNTHCQAMLGAQDAGYPVASLQSFCKSLTVNVRRSISLCWMKWLTGIWANLSPLAYLWQQFQFFSDKAHTSGGLVKQGTLRNLLNCQLHTCPSGAWDGLLKVQLFCRFFALRWPNSFQHLKGEFLSES